MYIWKTSLAFLFNFSITVVLFFFQTGLITLTVQVKGLVFFVFFFASLIATWLQKRQCEAPWFSTRVIVCNLLSQPAILLPRLNLEHLWLAFLSAGLLFSLRCPTLAKPVKFLNPSAPVALNSTKPVTRQCHYRRHLMWRQDAKSTQDQKSSASLCLTTRWTGVGDGRSITQLPTLLHQY